MKYLIFALALLLSACTTVVPVTAKFPEAPIALTSCPELKKLDQNTQLSDVAKILTANYSEYYTCAVKNDAWVEWYTKQKAIFEGISK